MVHDFRVKAPHMDRERESKRSGAIFTLEMKQYRVSGDKPGFLSELRIKPLGSSQEHAPFLFLPASSGNRASSRVYVADRLQPSSSSGVEMTNYSFPGLS